MSDRTHREDADRSNPTHLNPSEPMPPAASASVASSCGRSSEVADRTNVTVRGGAKAARLVDSIMAKVRGIDLDEISHEEAIELGTQITTMLRAIGYADLSSEDYKTLSELMRKLTGRR